MSVLLDEFIQSNQQVADETLSLLHKRYLTPTDRWGYSWGFTDLNRLTGGIQWEESRELTFVASRPNVGKSAFGVGVGLCVADEFLRGYPHQEVRIILLEMDPKQCYMRMVSQIANVSSMRMRQGYLDGNEWGRVEAAIRSLKKLPIRWMRGRHTVDNITEFVQGKHEDRACGLWIVDHVGIIPTSTAIKTGNQSFALGEISGALHFLARTVAPGIVLAQLNREGDKRSDPTPRASDVYGSDRILQDADNLILLDRPDLRTRTAEDERPEQELAYLLLEKQRSGPAPAKMPVLFLPEQSQWIDMPGREAHV